MVNRVLSFVAAAAIVGLSAGAAFAEDFSVINGEKGVVTYEVKELSYSDTTSYAFLDWDARVREDTQDSFNTYLNAMEDAADAAANAPVKDVVPGTSDARGMIGEDVKGKIDSIRGMYDREIAPR